MIPEIIIAAKYLGLLGGGWVARLLLVKYLGKTKEEAEIVLNWEVIHEKRDKRLLSEIKSLKEKMQEFMDQMEEERVNHKREILRWESSDRKKEKIIKDLQRVILGQDKLLERKDKKIEELTK